MSAVLREYDNIVAVLRAFGLGKPEQIRQLGGTATVKYAVSYGPEKYVVRKRPGEFSGESLVNFDHNVLGRLSSAGLPVPCPLRNLEGQSFYGDGEGVYEILSWVEGEQFDPGDIESIENLGEFLGRLHKCFEDDIPAGKEGFLREDHPDLLWKYVSELRPLCRDQRQVQQLSEIEGQLHLIKEKLDSGVYQRLRHSVIHGDVHPGNFHFIGSKVSAVYDFDYMSYQARVRDVCDGVMFFAAERPQRLQPDDICSLTQTFRFDLEKCKVFMDGYHRISRLSRLEWQALRPMVRSRWVQIRLRGSRKVAENSRLDYVTDGFFGVIDWLDNEAEAFLEQLAGNYSENG